MAPLKIGEQFYNCSFTILDQQVRIYRAENMAFPH